MIGRTQMTTLAAVLNSKSLSWPWSLACIVWCQLILCVWLRLLNYLAPYLCLFSIFVGVTKGWCRVPATPTLLSCHMSPDIDISKITWWGGEGGVLQLESSSQALRWAASRHLLSSVLHQKACQTEFLGEAWDGKRGFFWKGNQLPRCLHLLWRDEREYTVSQPLLL